jgi:Na+/citrate or Na+/malate symporter
MNEYRLLKIFIAVYFFVLGFIVFYGIDIIIQHLTQHNIDWTKYISSAFSHALMISVGAVFGWDECKKCYEWDHF